MARIQISDLRHRVHLCSQKDVVDTAGSLHLNREGVLSMWAAIAAKAASSWSPTGAAMNESKAKRTHIITTRYHRDLDITALAWLYEDRRKSASRWFKVLKVNQTETSGVEYFHFDCRLVERNTDAPVEDASETTFGSAEGLPSGVAL